MSYQNAMVIQINLNMSLSPLTDAFKLFEKAGELCCIPGQSTHAITGMYNVYRASQLMFPHEHLLTDARNYSANFLHKKRLNNALLDKWIITKDLPGEVHPIQISSFHVNFKICHSSTNNDER